MTPYFDHEKLHVYQEALAFVHWVTPLLERVPKRLAAWGQIDRASTSSPMNIAEGNGKFTGPDRCKFFDIARGSALECAAGLDVLVAKKILLEADIREGKERLQQIVSMLVGLIRSNSSDRLYEMETLYRAEVQREGESKQ